MAQRKAGRLWSQGRRVVPTTLGFSRPLAVAAPSGTRIAGTMNVLRIGSAFYWSLGWCISFKQGMGRKTSTRHYNFAALEPSTNFNYYD